MPAVVLGRSRIDGHAADRIALAAWRRPSVAMVVLSVREAFDRAHGMPILLQSNYTFGALGQT